MTKPLICIFCGEQSAYAQPTILSCITSIASYRIFCDSCYATGGEHSTEAAAIDEWKRILSSVEIRSMIVQARKETNPVVSLTEEEYEELDKFVDSFVKYGTDYDIKAFQKSVKE